MIEGGRDLLGRRLDDPQVRQYLQGLGEVRESSEEEEQDPEHYAAVVSAGLELMSEEGVIQAVTLYGGGHDGYARYAGPLPLGLSIGLRRREVRALLGIPQFEVEAADIPHLGRVGPCDRYDGDAFSTALDYDESTGQIRTIQLLLPAAVPR